MDKAWMKSVHVGPATIQIDTPQGWKDWDYRSDNQVPEATRAALQHATVTGEQVRVIRVTTETWVLR